jgi:hypothetical protein
MDMKYLSTPLEATGWKNTLVNDSDGNTLLLMPNGHKGLEAVQEATALFAAAPDMLAALEWWQAQMRDDDCDDMFALLDEMSAKAHAAIAKAKGEA